MCPLLFSGNPLNTDTSIILTFWRVPLVSVLTGFHCIWISFLTVVVKASLMTKASQLSPYWSYWTRIERENMKNMNEWKNKSSSIEIHFNLDGKIRWPVLAQWRQKLLVSSAHRGVSHFVSFSVIQDGVSGAQSKALSPRTGQTIKSLPWVVLLR